MTYYCIKCVRASKPEEITRKIALARIGVSLTGPSRLLKRSSREKPVCTVAYKIWREAWSAA